MKAVRLLLGLFFVNTSILPALGQSKLYQECRQSNAPDSPWSTTEIDLTQIGDFECHTSRFIAELCLAAGTAGLSSFPEQCTFAYERGLLPEDLADRVVCSAPLGGSTVNARLTGQRDVTLNKLYLVLHFMKKSKGTHSYQNSLELLKVSLLSESEQGGDIVCHENSPYSQSAYCNNETGKDPWQLTLSLGSFKSLDLPEKLPSGSTSLTLQAWNSKGKLVNVFESQHGCSLRYHRSSLGVLEARINEAFLLSRISLAQNQ